MLRPPPQEWQVQQYGFFVFQHKALPPNSMNQSLPPGPKYEVSKLLLKFKAPCGI